MKIVHIMARTWRFDLIPHLIGGFVAPRAWMHHSWFTLC